VRAADCHYCPAWVSALWLVAGLVALLYTAACHRGVPAVDPGPQPPVTRGTLAGTVHGPGEMALPGRTVEVVNIATGEKRATTTANNGGFTIDLPQGRYRLELPLRGGEALVKQPDVVDLDRAGSNIEFVVSPARGSRRPSNRLDNGLGSPIA
jgi:hypothetical protein